MPRFIAAAKPTFSGNSRRRALSPATRRTTSREPSRESLSTIRVSVATPRCASADPTETGRSASSLWATTMMETSIMRSRGLRVES